MNKVEALSKMNSDMQLWEAADSKDLGNGKVEKTINLPWGIGVTSVVLEGMTDASKRRSAVGAYGDYIRGVINDKIGEENVTARAQQKAASLSEDSSRETDSRESDNGGAHESERQETADKEPVQTPQAVTGGELEPDARLADLQKRVGEANNFIQRAKKEIAALEAYVEIMNNSTEESDDGSR